MALCLLTSVSLLLLSTFLWEIQAQSNCLSQTGTVGKRVGEDMAFFCGTSGSTNHPTFAKDGDTIGARRDEARVFTEEALGEVTLKILDANFNDEGKYTCTDGACTETFVLNVYKDIVFPNETTEAVQLIKDGEDGILSCTVASNQDTLKIQWSHNGEVLTSNDRDYIINTGNNELTIKSADVTEEGIYTCTASIPGISVTKSVDIFVDVIGGKFTECLTCVETNAVNMLANLTKGCAMAEKLLPTKTCHQKCLTLNATGADLDGNPLRLAVRGCGDRIKPSLFKNRCIDLPSKFVTDNLDLTESMMLAATNLTHGKACYCDTENDCNGDPVEFHYLHTRGTGSLLAANSLTTMVAFLETGHLLFLMINKI